MRFLPLPILAMSLFLVACSGQPEQEQAGGCFSVDECFDVKNNDYTIQSEGYIVRAEGVFLPANQPWELVMIKQQESGFVRGINDGDDYHWEERIDIAYDPNAVVDPMTFSKVVTRICKQGQCKTMVE